MAAPLIAAGVSAAANMIGGHLAGKAASKAAKEAAAIQQANLAKLQQQLEAIGIPSIEAQKIALTDPQYAGDLIAEQLGDTQLAQVSADSAMRQKRMEAIRALEERSATGLTASEKAEFANLSDQVNAEAKARDNAILSQMAQSGTMDSGASLAQRLMANQAATQRQAQQARDLGAEASNRRFAAVQALGDQAGRLEDIDYGRAADVAGRRDVIAEANARNRMNAGQFNLGRKDALASDVARNRSEEERANKGLIRTNYQDKLNRFNTMSGIQNQQADISSGLAQQAGQGKAQMYAGLGSAVGNMAGAYGQKLTQDAQYKRQDEQAALDRQNELDIARARAGIK